MAPSHDILWLIPVSVFVGGLIGSPHCVSMCGPLVIGFAQSRIRLLLYQIGRLVSYTVMGAIVGGFGEEVLGHDRHHWVSLLALAAISILLFINGFRLATGRPLHLPVPRRVSQFMQKIWANLRLFPPQITSFLAGVFTVFLPCGHLYSFLLGAVATGSAWRGAGFMFAFWMGSTPLLSVSTGLLQSLFRKNPSRRQRWAASLMMLAGFLSLLAFGLQSSSFAASSPQASSADSKIEMASPRCH